MNALTVIPPMPISDVERIANAIARGGLFGCDNINAVMTLCLLAQAEGQHPAVVFRDYHLIQGKPAKKAEAMLRDFLSSGGKVEWHTLTDEKADATFSHPHGGSVRIDWDVQRAQAADLKSPMWRKYPRAMLRSRVVSEGVRSVCPSATSGLYEVGEVQDIVADKSDVVDGGFIEGQFQEGAVSPNEPAKPARGSRQSGLKTAYRQFVHELNACGDVDELAIFLALPESLRVVKGVKEKLPHWWDGDNWPETEERPEEFELLCDLLSRRERECAERTASYLTAG